VRGSSREGAVYRNGQLKSGQRREPEADGGAGSRKRETLWCITIPGQANLDDRLAGVADALKNFPAMKADEDHCDDKGDWAQRLRPDPPT